MKTYSHRARCSTSCRDSCTAGSQWSGTKSGNRLHHEGNSYLKSGVKTPCTLGSCYRVFLRPSRQSCMMSRLKLDVLGPIRAGCNIWVLLLEDRNLEMVLKGRPWSDFSGRITYGLADLRGDAFGGVTAGALLLPQGHGLRHHLGSGTRGRASMQPSRCASLPQCSAVPTRSRPSPRPSWWPNTPTTWPPASPWASSGTTSPNCTAGRKSPASRSPAGWPTILNYWRSATPCW